MDRKGLLWITAVFVLLVSAYAVPYTILSDVDAWYGSFLFWLVLALAAFSINASIARKWRD